MNLLKTRVHLRSAQFPLLSGDIGETVINRNIDYHNSGLPQHQGSESQHNLGKPMVIYLENAIPIAEGYTTVCYEPRELDCTQTFGMNVCDIVRLARPRQCETTYAYIGDDVTVATVHHRTFLYQKGSDQLWELQQKDCCDPPISKEADCPASYLNDESVVDGNHKKVVCDESIQKWLDLKDCELVPIDIKCLKTECLIGITATDNRLVMYSDDTVYWGNIESGKEEDFVPSFTNGANGVKPSDLKGRIVVGYPLADGVVFYGTENAVFMSFNGGDIHNKYKFELMPGVGGIRDKKHIAYQDNGLAHYVWSSNGLQLVAPRREAHLVFPDVTEFLQGNLIEDYIHQDDVGIENLEPSRDRGSCQQPATSGASLCNAPNPEVAIINELNDVHGNCGYATVCPHIIESVVPCEDGLNKKLATVGVSYLAISYGRECGCVYDYILLYDERLRRWGKLKIRHKAVFELPKTSSASHAIGILTEDDKVVGINTNHVRSVACTDREVKDCCGVIVLGRFSMDRRAVSELHTVSIQRVHPEARFSLRVYPTWDGFTSITDVPDPTPETTNVGVRTYVVRSSGYSHTIDMVGMFRLTSLVLGFKYNGRENR